jgi:hypothetical protein
LPFWLDVDQTMSSTVAVSRLLRSRIADEHSRCQMLRVQMRQRALAGLADPARGANGVDDIGLGHDDILSSGEIVECRQLNEKGSRRGV